MCWCWPFSNPKPQKRKSTSSGERKRREKPAQDLVRGNGIPVVAETPEKRRSRDSDYKRRSKEKVATREPRRERAAQYQDRTSYQSQYQRSPRYDKRYREEYRSRDAYKPNLHLDVPQMWHRSVDGQSSNSSTEMLLNPRPTRSQGQHRRRHPKPTSSSTLRGRGAKRDPPRHSKSKKSLKQDSPHQTSGWSWFAASPPKSSRHAYTTYDTSSRNHRSPRNHQYQQIPEASSSSSPQRSPRHHRPRQQHQPASSTRSRTPNTAAHRTPDRRFAVLAATNAALEDVRREAFSQPSPPPRRERRRRYQGVAIPTSSIPFNWDCVSSSQTSAGVSAVGGPSVRQRRQRR